MKPRKKQMPPIGNRPDPKTSFYCHACWRDMDPGKPYRVVHVIGGGARILHPGDEGLYVSDDGDLGALPIGNDCARKLGLEWTSKPRISQEG